MKWKNTADDCTLYFITGTITACQPLFASAQARKRHGEAGNMEGTGAGGADSEA